MAKKRRRKLKKSVKRGCGLFLFLLISIPVIYLSIHYRKQIKQRVIGERTIVSAAEEKQKLPLNEALVARLDSLKHSSQRLDTNNIAITVYDLTANASVMRWNDRRLMAPASCLKLLTATTALKQLGMQHEYETTVSIKGKVKNDTLFGALIVHADADPLTESLAPLADAVREKGIRYVKGALVLDLIHKDTLKAHPSAASWDIPYHKVPILLKGKARVRNDLTYLLRTRGVTLANDERYVAKALLSDSDAIAYTKALKACKQKAHRIYRHTNKLTDIVTPMLIHSSNIKADALFAYLHQVKGAPKDPIQAFIDNELKLSSEEQRGFVINDGSGLSPLNRVTPDFLLCVLRYAWNDKTIRHYYLREALATPAHPERHGSLLSRMTAQKFRNHVFCKTGTLVTIGASSLAGYAQGSDGHWYAFVVVNEDSPVGESRIYQDKVCAELVR